MSATALLAAAAWGGAFACLAFGAVRAQRRRRRIARLATVTQATPPPVHAHDLRQDPRRMLLALGNWLEARSPRQAALLARGLDGAGIAGKITVAELLGYKVLLGVAGTALGAAVGLAELRVGLLAALVVGIAGYFGPDLLLRHLKRARLGRMLRDLPTVIDLLAVSLQAGIGLDRTLRMICDRVRSPLSDELRRVLTDISIGLSRHEAFMRLVQRVPSDEVRLLINSIIQSEQLGTSLVSTVKNQAQQLRTRRRRRAEGQALRAPVKMLMPMVLFILPALFIVVLGPPGLNVGLAISRGNP